MLRVIRICRKCGARILSDAPEGLCARCVLKIALAMPRDPVAGGVDPGSPDELSRGDATAAPDGKKTAHAAELLGELGDYELLEESDAAVRAWYFAPGKRVSIAQSP
jgi:hypothetical protein